MRRGRFCGAGLLDHGAAVAALRGLMTGRLVRCLIENDSAAAA